MVERGAGRRAEPSRRPATSSAAGSGRLAQRGRAGGEVHYDWRVEVEKPLLLKPLTPLLRPVYAAEATLRAMARGEEGLRRELVRGRAAA